MTLASIQRVFAVDEKDRVRANIAYIKNKNGVYGAFFGYCGGGAYDEGFFAISTTNEINIGSDSNFINAEYEELFEELSLHVHELLNHEEQEGGISELGDDLRVQADIYFEDGGCEYRSKKVTLKVLKLLSENWSLNYHW